jgi:hypothetical protein
MIRATHLDGPMAGAANDVSLSAPRTPAELWYAKVPDGTEQRFTGLTPAGYVLVGYDRYPPSGAWPGLAHYRLDRDRSELRAHAQHAGMEEGVAVYVHEQEER